MVFYCTRKIVEKERFFNRELLFQFFFSFCGRSKNGYPAPSSLPPFRGSRKRHSPSSSPPPQTFTTQSLLASFSFRKVTVPPPPPPTSHNAGGGKGRECDIHFSTRPHAKARKKKRRRRRWARKMKGKFGFVECHW